MTYSIHNLGQIDLKPLLSSVVDPALKDGNIKATIKTQVLPPITLDFYKIRTSPLNPILKIAKPKIDIEAFGLTKTIAPWGLPTEDYFPFIVLGILGVILLFVFIGYSLAK